MHAMTDTPEPETPETPGEPEMPVDPGISLSIRFALVLDPAERCPGAVVLRSYDLDTGALLLNRSYSEPSKPDEASAIAEIPVNSGILLAAYDGDTGRLMRASTLLKSNVIGEDGEDERGVPMVLSRRLADCGADPNGLCQICDPDVPSGAALIDGTLHPECMLMNVLGPLGHHLDHSLWCENIGDPLAGRTLREAALELDRMVTERGFKAMVANALSQEGGH
jgi:hypothetical protein